MLGMNANNGEAITENPENKDYDIVMEKLFLIDFLPIACEKYLMITDKANSCLY